MAAVLGAAANRTVRPRAGIAHCIVVRAAADAHIRACSRAAEVGARTAFALLAGARNHRWMCAASSDTRIGWSQVAKGYLAESKSSSRRVHTRFLLRFLGHRHKSKALTSSRTAPDPDRMRYGSDLYGGLRSLISVVEASAPILERKLRVRIRMRFSLREECDGGSSNVVSSRFHLEDVRGRLSCTLTPGPGLVFLAHEGFKGPA